MWTLPNVLTCLRLVAVPFIGAVLAVAGDTSDGRLVALSLFVAASITDAADGWVARRRGQCTELGALVDPIADKAVIGTSLVCLSWLGIVPWWATVVILAREVAVTVLRLAVVQRAVIPASRGGKVKTATQTALIVLALAAPGWTEVVTTAVVLAVLSTLATGVDYAVKAAALTGATTPAIERPSPAARRQPVDSRH